MNSALYGDYSWDELRKKAFQGVTIIIPMGAVEAHGKHSPVDTDAVIPTGLAVKVAEKTGALVLPPVSYGFCYTLRMFPGTISLRSHTLAKVYEDIVRELVRNGFTKILFLNGHGGNNSVASHVLKELSSEVRFKACVIDWWQLVDYGEGVGHADAIESFFYEHFKPGFVKPVKQEKHASYVGAVFPPPRDIFTESGYMGSAKPIPKKTGDALVNKVIDKLAKIVKADLALKE